MSKRKKKKSSAYRSDIISLVPKGVRRVLDVGCSDGALGKQLKSSGMEVVGVELNAEACRKAGNVLDKVFSANVENFSLPFPAGYFDCILFADILEHLHNPGDVLKKYGFYLNNNGVVISSIPNIRYYKAVIRLLRGSWDYMDGGILDKSHLRFFTLINIKEMFQEAGYKIERIERNIVSARGFRIWNFFMFNKLKDFLTYQYYIVAKKNLTGVIESRKRKVYQF